VRQFYHGITASFICVVLAADVATARAQGGGNNGAPAGWQIVMQSAQGANANPPLRPMGPDVHLTAEASGRYFRLTDTFTDSATATVGFRQLPGGLGSVGLFVSTLDESVRVEILVRGDNQYSVVAVQRGVDTMLVNWTAVPAGDMSSGNPKIVFSVGRDLLVSINSGAPVAIARIPALNGQLRMGLVNVGSVNTHVAGFTVDRAAAAATAAAVALPHASKSNASLPAWSPDGRTIAFALRNTAEGFDQVHIIDADGTHERQLTTGADNNTGPVFSPDGARVAYRSFHVANAATSVAARNMNDVSMKLMSVGRDGTDAREIASATLFGIPKWSLDSRELLFSALNGAVADLNISIDVASSLGTARRTLGPSPKGSLSSGSWAHDGRIAFPVPSEHGSVVRIQERDGSKARMLPAFIAYQQEPVWSPDGKWLALMGSDRAIPRRGTGQALYVVRVDGTNPHVIVRDAQNVANVSFSPDGRRILFQDMRSGSTDIYTVATDGTGEQRLTRETGMNESPSWSPDGKRILFQSDRDAGGALGGSGIFVMDATGGQVKRIY
jgi:Tol biopolymer transport system component